MITVTMIVSTFAIFFAVLTDIFQNKALQKMWVDGRTQAELKEQNVVTAKMHNRFYSSPIYSFTTEAYYFEGNHCCTATV